MVKFNQYLGGIFKELHLLFGLVGQVIILLD